MAAGLAAGIAAAIVGGRAVQSLLFDVEPRDPVTLLGVCIVLGIVAVVACAIPARRATTMELATMLHPE